MPRSFAICNIAKFQALAGMVLDSCFSLSHISIPRTSRQKWGCKSACSLFSFETQGCVSLSLVHGPWKFAAEFWAFHAMALCSSSETGTTAGNKVGSVEQKNMKTTLQNVQSCWKNNPRCREFYLTLVWLTCPFFYMYISNFECQILQCILRWQALLSASRVLGKCKTHSAVAASVRQNWMPIIA